MADEQRLVLEVALVRDGHMIRGTVADGAGPAVGFDGWLELMSALDTVCARADRPRPAIELPE